MAQYDLPENIKMTTGARLWYEQLVDGSLTLLKIKRKKAYLRRTEGKEQELVDTVVALELYKRKVDGINVK